jgi:hypothetical protein
LTAVALGIVSTELLSSNRVAIVALLTSGFDAGRLILEASESSRRLCDRGAAGRL